jgi:hypothetical protein
MEYILLEIIGFIAIAYIIFKMAPTILEAGFKFAVICIGLISFIFIIGLVWGSLSVNF